MNILAGRLMVTSFMLYTAGMYFYFIFKLYNNLVYEIAKETLMYRTVLWTLWKRTLTFSLMSLKTILYISRIEPGLATRFLHDILHVSMSFSQIFPPSPSPTESIRLFYTSVSLLLSRTPGYCKV